MAFIRCIAAAVIACFAPISLQAQTITGSTPLPGLIGAVYGGAYGMNCNGSTDNTTALQNAVDAAQRLAFPATGNGGGTLYLPPGFCMKSGPITITSGIRIIGAGRGVGAGAGNSGGTVIRDTVTTGDSFVVTTTDAVHFEAFTIDSVNYKASGACISLAGNASLTTLNRRSSVVNMLCDRSYDGMRIDMGIDVYVSGTEFHDFMHDGILKINAAIADSGQDKYIGNTYYPQNTHISGTEDNNPFTTVDTSSTVTVAHTAHGRVTGQIAVFRNAATFNNVSVDGKYPITVTDADHFTITVGTTANASGTGGGTPYYWYGSNAGFEFRAGGDIVVSDSKLLGSCWNFLINKMSDPTGDIRLTGNSFEQAHCANVGAIQGTPGSETGQLILTGNEYSIIPGNNGNAPEANQPVVASVLYVGSGTPTTQTKWISKISVIGGTVNDTVASAVSMFDIEDGDNITLDGLTLSNGGVVGQSGIKIGDGASNVVIGSISHTGMPSGLYASTNFGSILGQTVQGTTSGKNLVDNGSMIIAQRAAAVSGLIGGGTTGGAGAAQYSADRWWIDTNVTSGAGYSGVKSAGPSPPQGFVNSITLTRFSGSLTQPVCAHQAIPTDRSDLAAGKDVILSFWVRGQSGITGTTVTGYIATGTGSDTPLTTSASPAVTPAWTNLVSYIAVTATLTQSFVRVSSNRITLDSNIHQIDVIICYNPGAGTGSSTDAAVITGVQLEIAGPNQATASNFDIVPRATELERAQRYYYEINETAGAVFGNGMISATDVQTVTIPLPVTMRKIPTVVVTAGGFQFNIAGTLTPVGAGFAAGGTQSTSGVSVVGALTATAGQATQLVGSNTTGKITVSADF